MTASVEIERTLPRNFGVAAFYDIGNAFDPGNFFSNPGLWIGLAVAAGFVAATVWMRRYREPL